MTVGPPTAVGGPLDVDILGVEKSRRKKKVASPRKKVMQKNIPIKAPSGGAWTLFTVLAVAAVAALFFFSNPNVRAGSADNVFGYAFNKDYGYLSMNCNNTAALDGSGSRTDDCAVPYGTNIGQDGKLSGLAWGPNIGWMCFGDTCNGMQLPGSRVNALGASTETATVISTNTTVGTYAAISGQVTAGATTIPVLSSVGFLVDDLVMIHQTQGSNVSNLSTTTAGTYELDTVASLTSTSITVRNPLQHFYYGHGFGGDNAQVVRVLNYTDLTVKSGAILSARPWSASAGGGMYPTGGILAMNISGTLTIESGGKISMSGNGFIGQPSSNPGESYKGPGSTGTNANWGGGGGGGGGSPIASSGAGGGYGVAGGAGSLGQGPAAQGGQTYGAADLSVLHLGSGGGGAANPSGCCTGTGSGASGGGAVFIVAGALTGGGIIEAKGAGGQAGKYINTNTPQTAAGGGGGGSGGSVFIQSLAVGLPSSNVMVTGGTGGAGESNNPGGAGGVGRIAIAASSPFPVNSASGCTYPCPVVLPNDFAAQVSTSAVSRGNLDGHVTSGKGGYAMMFNSGGEIALSGTATNGSPFGVFVNTTGASTSNTNGRCKNDDGSDMTVGAGEFCGLGWNQTLGFIRFRGVITIPDSRQTAPRTFAFTPAATTKNVTATPSFSWKMVDPEGDPQVASELVVCRKDLNGNCESDPVPESATSISGTATVGVFASIKSDAAAGATTLTVDTTSGFAPLDAVLIHQTQSVYETHAGVYEFNSVASVTPTTITLKNPLAKSYATTGVERAQVVRVFNYTDLTIPAGAVLTTLPWDGSKGGVLAVSVAGALNIQSGGKIDMSGTGFRGGNDSPAESYGYQGESYFGQGIPTSTANAGGGGGGRPTIGGWWNEASKYYTQFQPGGGAGGGYGTGGTNGGGGGDGWYSQGGTSYGAADLTQRADLGSGGGAGGWNSAGYGGAGGGAAIIIANNLSVAGTIESRGGVGASNGNILVGGSGGGSGGSILVASAASVPSSALIVTGGTGGYGGSSVSYGGTGGAGRVSINTSGAMKPLSGTVAHGQVMTSSSGSCVYPCATASAADLTTGLLGYWKLDGNAVDTTGAHNGTLHGSPTTVTGRVGTALVFHPSSNDYIDAGTFASSSAATIAAWIQPSGTDYSSGQMVMAGSDSIGSGASGRYALFAKNAGGPCAATGDWGINLSDGTTSQNVCSGQTYNAANFPAGAWTHLAVTYDGTTVKFYRDGQLVKSAAQPVQGAASAQPFSIGRVGAYGGYYFNGGIDDARIYTRALSASDVAALVASAGTAVPVVGLQANTPYTWKVRTTDAFHGLSTQPFVSSDFQVGLATPAADQAPTALALGPNSDFLETPLTPTFQWGMTDPENDAQTSTMLTLCQKSLRNSSITNCATDTGARIMQAAVGGSASTCTYPCGALGAPAQLLPGTDYTWQVMVTDAGGLQSPLSSEVLFHTVASNVTNYIARTSANFGSNLPPVPTPIGPGGLNLTLTPTFSWQYADPEHDPQTAVEIVVCNKSINPNCENDPPGSPSIVLRGMVPNTATQSCVFPCGIAGAPATLPFGTEFTWKVRVTDAFHNIANQPFVAPSSSGAGQCGVLTPGECPSTAGNVCASASFTTIPHNCPTIAFGSSAQQARILAGVPVTFTNSSQCFNSTNAAVACAATQWDVCTQPNTSVASCPPGKLQTFTTSTPTSAVLAPSCGSTKTCTFAVRLRITDGDGFMKNAESTVTVGKRSVPTIRTITPF